MGAQVAVPELLDEEPPPVDVVELTELLEDEVRCALIAAPGGEL